MCESHKRHDEMSHRNKLIGFVIVIGVFALDRLAKDLFLRELTIPVSIANGLLSFHFVKNSGVAFGFFKGYNQFFIIFNTLLLLFLFYIRRKVDSVISFYAISGIVGGAVGNIFDRIKYGYVIDFIDFKFFPAVFNIADFFITIGVILVIIDGKLMKRG